MPAGETSIIEGGFPQGQYTDVMFHRPPMLYLVPAAAPGHKSFPGGTALKYIEETWRTRETRV